MNRLILPLAAAWTSVCLQAQVLFTFEFPGSDPAGDQTAPAVANVSVSPFTRLNVNAASQADVFASSYWTAGSTRDPGEYASFTLRPDVGYELALDSLSWDTSRTSTGPQTGRVELYRDGSSLAATADFGIGTAMAPQTFDFDNVTVSPADLVEFRFYGWNASSSGNMRFDNVRVTGELTPIPEPKPLALIAGTSLAGLLIFRQRWSPFAKRGAVGGKHR